MTPVRRNSRIAGIKGRMNAGSNGFLPIVKMAKATNVAGLVLVVTGNFHTTHGVHEFEHFQQFFLAAFDSGFGGRVQVVCLLL